MNKNPFRPWTKEEIEIARKLCAESTSVTEVCEKIHKQLKRSTTPDRLRDVFTSRGLPTPFNLLRVDPIARYEKVQTEALLKREHKKLVEQLQEAEARQKVLDRLDEPIRLEKIKRREKGSGTREGCAIILASDWHVEEYIPKRADTGGNFYNLQVAEKRAERFFQGVRDLLDMNRPVFGLRDVVLWLGGDLMNGYLRNESLEENELSPVETVTWLKAKLCSGIDHLLEDEKIEKLTIICSHGNHGRTTEKRQTTTGAQNSYEWLLYQWLDDHYKDEKRITFVTDQSNHQYLDVYDFNLHFHHGDEVKYQGGIGGIAIPLLKAVAGWDQVRKCHFHAIGHWHQLRDFGSVTVNGSLCGYNAYAMSIRAAFEPPQQAFYILDSKRGKTAQFPIWVADKTDG